MPSLDAQASLQELSLPKLNLSRLRLVLSASLIIYRFYIMMINKLCPCRAVILVQQCAVMLHDTDVALTEVRWVYCLFDVVYKIC